MVTKTEHLRGTGEVYAGEQKLGEGRYNLTVTQSHRSGLNETGGSLEMVDGDMDITGHDMFLTLHLNNGRQCDFLVRKGNPLAGTYTIVGTGAIRDE